MTATVTVADTGIQFECADGATILDAAQAAGHELPYSCRKGVCGNCRGRVRSGSVSVPAAAADALNAAERAAGYTLFCQAVPRGDVEIEAPRIRPHDASARRVVDARVFRMRRAAADVTILNLRFPTGTRVRFEAGQYLELLLDDGSRRAFSMANPPHQNDGVELHVRHVPGGMFSEHVLPGLAPGATLRVELPFGEFRLAPAADGDPRPAILLASGTGFAPIKSMLEAEFRAKSQRPLVLYWGGRRSSDLYLLELVRGWVDRHPNFRFVPVVSEPDGDWGGRRGFVHRAVIEDFPSLLGHAVHACGVPAMITAARRDFCEGCGLDSGAFYCDAFASPSGSAT